MRICFVLVFFFLLPEGHAQTFTQWAQTVHWDGVSHWSRYMITLPAYQGPNSLPVPHMSNGSIDSSFSISATCTYHFSDGDHTRNICLYANYCLVKELIAVDAFWVPYEHYTMSQAVKEKRHVFSQFFYDHEATGELQMNTNFQLMNKWKKYIRLALRIGYRFPTGSGFGAARYTDGPGYNFDLSFGKPFNHSALTWTGMLGFYSWQMQSDRHNQDDAFLFGTGMEWNKNNWRIKTNVAGYLGYFGKSGDKPIVYRFNLEKKIKKTSVLFGFQQGLHDFKYSSVEIGAKYLVRMKEMKLAKSPK
jgi:hypothetical protein